jgi:predicted RNase H-like HicB family nuclease
MTEWWAKVYKISDSDLGSYLLDAANNCRGYVVRWSDYDQAFVARTSEFSSLAAHGDTVEEAFYELRFMVAHVLELFYRNEIGDEDRCQCW